MTDPRVSPERLAEFLDDNTVAFSHVPTGEVPIAVLLAWDLRDERARNRELVEALGAMTKHVCYACDAREVARAALAETEKGAP